MLVYPFSEIQEWHSEFPLVVQETCPHPELGYFLKREYDQIVSPGLEWRRTGQKEGQA